MNDTFVKKIIPKLQPEEIITFLWDDNTVLHRHSDWEFTSTMDGTGINVVNGEEHPLMPGIFVLLGPKHVHRYYSDAPIKRHDICVPDEKMRQLADILQPDLYKKLSSSEKPIIIKLSVESFNEIHERLSKIDLLGQDNRDVRAILVSIVMYLLGVYLEHKSEKNMPKSVISFLQRISDPRRVLYENKRHYRVQFLFALSIYQNFQNLRRKNDYRIRNRFKNRARGETAFFHRP